MPAQPRCFTCGRKLADGQWRCYHCQGPKKRRKRGPPRPRHRHRWEFKGRAGIFDPQRLYICKDCGRRQVRKPRKPRKKLPLAR